MTMFKTTDVIQVSDAPASAVVDAVMRATGILLLMAIGVIHLVQLVPTFRSTPLLGLAFVALIVASVGVGARLVHAGLSGTRLWLPALALGVGAIAGYAFTRVMSTPLDNQDVGNWSCMLGMAALYVEGTLVVLSAYAISAVSAISQRRPASPATGTSNRVPQPVKSLARVGHTDVSGNWPA